MIEKVVTTVYKINIQGEPFNLTEEEFRKLVTDGMKALGIKEQTGPSLKDLADALKKPISPLPVPEIPIEPLIKPRKPRQPYQPYDDGYDPHWYPDGTGYPYKMPPQVID